MCLAVPLEIVELRANSKALVRRGGETRGEGSFEIDLSLLDESRVGDFVLVHAGYAIGTVDRGEAEETLRRLESDGSRADR